MFYPSSRIIYAPWQLIHQLQSFQKIFLIKCYLVWRVQLKFLMQQHLQSSNVILFACSTNNFYSVRLISYMAVLQALVKGRWEIFSCLFFLQSFVYYHQFPLYPPTLFLCTWTNRLCKGEKLSCQEAAFCLLGRSYIFRLKLENK